MRFVAFIFFSSPSHAIFDRHNFFLTIGHKNGKNRLRDEGFAMCLSPTPLRSLCMKLTEIVWTRNFHFLKRCSFNRLCFFELFLQFIF